MTSDVPLAASPPPTRRHGPWSRRAWARTAALAGCVLTLTACGGAATATSATTVANGHHPGHGRHHVVVGVLTAVSSQTLALKSHHKTVTVLLEPHTRYRERGQSVRESALRKGEDVRARLAPHASAPTALVVTILPPALVGIIRTIRTGGFLLAPAHGAIRTVTTVAATVYRSGLHRATASALRTGERVRVSGWPAAHGAIAATSVAILPAKKS